MPRLTAEVLLSHALKRERAYLYAHPEQELREVEWIHYGRYLHERAQGKPTQYITKRQEFYGREFTVSPAVLIPRPETEHLVEAALPFAGEADRVVDVGTGSGAIAVTLALETKRRIFAVDISTEALIEARANAARWSADVQLLGGDGLSAFERGSFDLVVSNPPYVAEGDRELLAREVREYEPGLALFAGENGLAFHRRLVGESERVLKPRGRLFLEIGARQAGAVLRLLGSRWANCRVYPDLAGMDRVIGAELKKN